MKKKLVSTVIILFLLFFSCLTAYAHSGRTDANGGHKDNNNVSNLGYYHYHHGLAAHLHPDGVCSYLAKEKVIFETTTLIKPSLTKAQTFIKPTPTLTLAPTIEIIPTLAPTIKLTPILIRQTPYITTSKTILTKQMTIKQNRANSTSKIATYFIICCIIILFIGYYIKKKLIR